MYEDYSLFFIIRNNPLILFIYLLSLISLTISKSIGKECIPSLENQQENQISSTNPLIFQNDLQKKSISHPKKIKCRKQRNEVWYNIRGVSSQLLVIKFHIR
ncbi:hypothetical protein FCM35_KLT04525 [Carex littledalei]|uniref:Uncharacterized protein n=1 Tax=Carex littledalei TaxID=544730 RepID=A0A833R0W2_9POAL|nr:hypothetical protein FCM35_KLT04525 [Carex littledalei]